MPPAPAAAKLLAESNIAVDQVQGSGKRGQVLKGDVLAAIARGAPSQPSAASVSSRPPRRPRSPPARRRRPTTSRARSACA